MSELAPNKCRDFNEVCKLNTDNFDTEDYWILYDGDMVTIAKQKLGEASTAKISIPKKDFDRLIRWYQRPQKLRKKK